MKKLITILFLVLPALLMAQGQPEYIMYRNIKITPKADKMEDFMKALGMHNKKYHSGEQPYHVSVWRPISGPDIGSIIYSIGPLTFKDMDMREVQEGHDEDWATVLSMSDGFEDMGFWRLDGDISTPGGTQYGKLRIRIIDLKSGENYRFEQCMKNIAKTYAEKKPNNSHWVFNRRLAHNDDKDVAVVFGYNNWSELDGTFSADYEAVHGEGSWDLFMEEIEDIIVSADDHLWEIQPDLSGDQ